MLPWLIENTVIALLLSGCVLLVTWFLRPRPAICHVLWLLVLVKLVTPPLFDWTSLAPAARQEVQSLYVEHVDPVWSAIVGTAAPVEPTPPVSVAPSTESAPPATASLGATPTESWSPSPGSVLLGAWILGSLTLLLFLLRRGLRARRLLRTRVATPDWLTQQAQQLSRRLGIRTPELVVLRDLTTPCTGGLLRTRVLWPEALTDVGSGDRTVPVLAHELAHVLRRDPMIARFELLGALAWFWNPLFWYLRSRVREYAEQDCDARAVALLSVPPRAYAETLLGLRAGEALPPVALPARGRGLKVFERRLSAIMAGRRTKLPRAFAVAAAGVLLALLPSWSLAPGANSPTSSHGVTDSSTPQDPPSRQDPQRARPRIGRIGHLLGLRATVLLDDGIDAPRKGGRLWIGDGKHVKGSMAVMDVGEGVFIGRLNDDTINVELGDGVWGWLQAAGKQTQPVAKGTVIQVTGSIITLKLAEDPLRDLQPDQSWAMYREGRRIGESTVQLVEKEFVFLRIRPEDAAEVGAEIELGKEPIGAGATVDKNGELGKPLAFGRGGGTGATVITDYSDNRIVRIGADGELEVLVERAYGAWDAERLPNGHLLITEFSVSRVREIDAAGNTVWKFEHLKNPYDADRLPNGNTLIADTFGDRVIEVDSKGEIVWKVVGMRAFDVERLQNGNTLIADALRDHVMELDPKGKLVWHARQMPSPHDVDRLDNGNTLITLRTLNKVVELTPDGQIALELPDLQSPSDADRLDNGNTLVAENGMVREFDPTGKVVWKQEMSWAVEVNRY